MFFRKCRSGTIICRYLPFTDPRLESRFRLPLVHIRMKQGSISFRTDALVDSGATGTFIPLEIAEILEIPLPQNIESALGAGGPFSTYSAQVELIQVLKGKEIFCEFRNLDVAVPTGKGAIPHCVLGRDSIFQRYDVTYREHMRHIVFKHARRK